MLFRRPGSGTKTALPVTVRLRLRVALAQRLGAAGGSGSNLKPEERLVLTVCNRHGFQLPRLDSKIDSDTPWSGRAAAHMFALLAWWHGLRTAQVRPDISSARGGPRGTATCATAPAARWPTTETELLTWRSCRPTAALAGTARRSRTARACRSRKKSSCARCVIAARALIAECNTRACFLARPTVPPRRVSRRHCVPRPSF